MMTIHISQAIKNKQASKTYLIKTSNDFGLHRNNFPVASPATC